MLLVRNEVMSNFLLFSSLQQSRRIQVVDLQQEAVAVRLKYKATRAVVNRRRIAYLILLYSQPSPALYRRYGSMEVVRLPTLRASCNGWKLSDGKHVLSGLTLFTANVLVTLTYNPGLLENPHYCPSPVCLDMAYLLINGSFGPNLDEGSPTLPCM